MEIERKENWESILAAELLKSKTMPFQYGKNDCTIWASNMLKTYSNLVWNHSWTNKREAMQLHKSKPMVNQVSDVLGEPIGNILATKRGDLVQKDTGLDSALGICIGNKVALLKPKIGICYADLKDCMYSWRI